MLVGLKRLFVILVSVLVQVALIVAIFIKFPSLRESSVLLFTVLSVFIMLFIIRLNISPDYKLTWFFVIILSPVLGALIFLMSRRKLFKKYKGNMEASSKEISSIEDDFDSVDFENTAIKKQAHYLINYADSKLYKNNQIKYYPLGEDMWEDMLIELKKAEKFIFMEYFIVQNGEMLEPILEILKKKAAEGLDVRFIFDSFGSLFKAPEYFARDMRKHGIKCQPFNKQIRLFDIGLNNRDHRKITVIDGKVAFTGGINIADEYINRVSPLGHWKDTGVKIKGSAANYFTIMFLTMWGMCEKKIPNYDEFLVDDYEVFKNDSLIAPYTDYPGGKEQIGETMYEEVLSGASEYVYMTSPYLILDYNMVNEFIVAAKSGVDMRLILPATADKKSVQILARSFYKPLLEAGVRIFEYTPGFIHSKQFVCDDELAIIGTINLDYRSLVHHIENAVWIVGDKSILDMKKDFLEVQAKSKEVLLEDIPGSKLMNLLFLPILRAFAPLF